MKNSERVVVVGRREVPAADGNGTTEVTLVKLPKFTKTFRKRIKEVREREKESARTFAHR